MYHRIDKPITPGTHQRLFPVRPPPPPPPPGFGGKPPHQRILPVGPPPPGFGGRPPQYPPMYNTSIANNPPIAWMGNKQRFLVSPPPGFEEMHHHAPMKDYGVDCGRPPASMQHEAHFLSRPPPCYYPSPIQRPRNDQTNPHFVPPRQYSQQFVLATYGPPPWLPRRQTPMMSPYPKGPSSLSMVSPHVPPVRRIKTPSPPKLGKSVATLTFPKGRVFFGPHSVDTSMWKCEGPMSAFSKDGLNNKDDSFYISFLSRDLDETIPRGDRDTFAMGLPAGSGLRDHDAAGPDDEEEVADDATPIMDNRCPHMNSEWQHRYLEFLGI